MHNHKDEHQIANGKLIVSLILNLIITVAEIIGGIISNSLSLLSDSFHNLNDTFAIFLAYMANLIGKKEKNEKYPYGYKRYEILAAFTNTILLLGLSVFLIIKGIEKFYNPIQINGNLMLIVATIGLLGNLFTVMLIFKDSKSSLNIKAMFVHIMSDTLSSISIIVGALLIIKYKWYILDPIFTLAISGYIIIESIHLLKDSARILLQRPPEWIDVNEIKSYLEQSFYFVKNIHNIRIWTTDGNEIYMEAHAIINEANNKNLDKYINMLKSALQNRFKIKNMTIQFEGERCLK